MLAKDHAANLFAFPCDVADPQAVETMVRQATERLGGGVRVLVNSAGTNTPRRSLEVLSVADYQALIDANLNGTFYCVRSVLPILRKQGGGTIVNIVSDAGLLANAKAGPAYVASKFGVAGLTQSINAEERDKGIRTAPSSPATSTRPCWKSAPPRPRPKPERRCSSRTTSPTA